MPQLYKKGKIIKQETIHNPALKMIQRLAKLNYRDTGSLSNATDEERKQIIALSMYYQIGKFDSSNQFIRTYRDKRIINLVKQYTIEEIHKMNALTNIYIHIHILYIYIYIYTHAIEQQMEQNKIIRNKPATHNNNGYNNTTRQTTTRLCLFYLLI